MKVTNWRRTLAASLLAGGLISPAAAVAANLDTNLVANPSFEDVDPEVFCCGYLANKILDWDDGSGVGFAYTYGLAYDAGGPLPGGGNYYFSPASNDAGLAGFTAPGQIAQNIDVSTGATATQIAAGEAAVKLSAYFTTYPFEGDEHDRGNLHVEFLDSGGGSLGSTIITAKPPVTAWQQAQGVTFIPVGAATLRASVFGTAGNFGPDGYTDLIDVQVAPAVNELLFVEVNTATGEATIKNQTGDSFHIDYYDITSASGALKANSWSSLQDQNQGGFPAGNGTGNGWEEIGGAGAKIIGEGYLTGNSAVGDGASVSLGAAFNTAGAHDLAFRYSVVPTQPLSADFDGDGDADGADLLTWQRNRGLTGTAVKAEGDANGDMNVDAADLAAWKTDFGSSGATGAGTVVRGFVRYVAPAAAATPEPGGVVLAGLGLATLAILRRR